MTPAYRPWRSLKRTFTRDEVIAGRECPLCDARRHETCIGIHGEPRWALHQARREAYRRHHPAQPVGPTY
jgi:hypothetical protein